MSTCIECRFALNDSLTSNRTIHMPWSRRHLDTGIRILNTNQEKNVSLDISLCKISSLEVYRGKSSVFEIEHSGFTLVDRNTIQVIIITTNISWLRHNLPGVGGWGGGGSEANGSSHPPPLCCRRWSAIAASHGHPVVMSMCTHNGDMLL